MQFDTLDRLLCGLNRVDLWYTEFHDYYYAGFRAAEDHPFDCSMCGAKKRDDRRKLCKDCGQRRGGKMTGRANARTRVRSGPKPRTRKEEEFFED